MPSDQAIDVKDQTIFEERRSFCKLSNKSGKTELPGIVTEFLSTQPLYGWICKQKSLTGKKYDKENFLTDRYYTKKTDELKNY